MYVGGAGTTKGLFLKPDLSGDRNVHIHHLSTEIIGSVIWWRFNMIK